MLDSGLTTETVKGSALSLEGVDNIKRSDSLSLGVLSVSNGVSNDGLEEGLQNVSGLLVDLSGNSLDTTSSRKTSDSGLSDTLDVISQNLSVTLGTTLSET